MGDGAGSGTSQPAPVEVSGGAIDWVAVTAGVRHTCARKATGRLDCWGSDGSGQLGNGAGSSTSQPAPVEVSGGATDWAAVAVGGSHTCARKTSGRLYCWGLDESGQVGNGHSATNHNPSAPVQVFGGATDWAAVAAGGSHTCARKTSGRFYCWGYDRLGQVGDGAPFRQREMPVEVFGGATDWSAVTAGLNHTCARKTAAGSTAGATIAAASWVTETGSASAAPHPFRSPSVP